MDRIVAWKDLDNIIVVRHGNDIILFKNMPFQDLLVFPLQVCQAAGNRNIVEFFEGILLIAYYFRINIVTFSFPAKNQRQLMKSRGGE
jgi:hypothetical protein